MKAAKHLSINIQYAGLTLSVTKNERGDEITPLKPISDLFGLKWENQRKKVTDDAYYALFYGTCTPTSGGAGGQNRQQTCILLSRVAAFLMSLNPSMISIKGNVDGARYLIEKQAEWADAIHDYEEMGIAINLNHIRSRDMLRKERLAVSKLVRDKCLTANPAERKLYDQLITSAAAECGAIYQPELPDFAKP